MTTEPKQHCIRFRYLRNISIHLPNGQIANIPHRTVPVQTSIPVRGSRPVEYWQAMSSEFDLTVIHEVCLKSETPMVPEDTDSLTPLMRAEVEKEAIAAASANRRENDRVRRYLHGLAAESTSDLGDGRIVTIPATVEIVSDSEATAMRPMQTHVSEQNNG